MKPGTIIEGVHGRFAKIVEVKGSRYGLSAWMIKRTAAEEETQVVTFLNGIGLAQVMKKEEASPAVNKAKKEKKEEAAK